MECLKDISDPLFFFGLFGRVAHEMEGSLCLVRPEREGVRQLIVGIEGLKHVGLDSAKRNNVL